MSEERCCNPECRHMNPMMNGCFICGQFTCTDCKIECCPDQILESLMAEMEENAVRDTVPVFQA